MKRKTILIVSMLLLIFFSSLACTPSRRPMPPQPGPGTNNPPSPSAPAPDTAPNPLSPAPEMQNNEQPQLAREIADEVEQVTGVNRAHVVLTGNTAYVGLDLAADIEGGRVTAIEKEAEKLAKATDKKLMNVMVTTDVDTVARIKKVAQGVREGRPLTGFAMELEEIGRRLAPTPAR